MARPHLSTAGLWRHALPALRAGRGQGAENSCAGPVVVGGLRQRRWLAGGLPPAQDRAPSWDAGPRRGGLPYGGAAARVQVARTEISHEVFEVSGAPIEPARAVASERAPADAAGAERAAPSSRGPGNRGARHRTTPMSSLPLMRGSTSAARCVAYCTAETYGGNPLSYKAARSQRRASADSAQRPALGQPGADRAPRESRASARERTRLPQRVRGSGKEGGKDKARSEPAAQRRIARHCLMSSCAPRERAFLECHARTVVRVAD
jgi:hypothetical protein